MQAKLIVALDTSDIAHAENLIKILKHLVTFKVGMELTYACALQGVSLKSLHIHPAKLMLDLKPWDIPNTVASASLPLIEALKPAMFTIPLPFNHLSVKNLQEEVKRRNLPTRVLGVTVLTAYKDQDVEDASNGAFKKADKAVGYYALKSRESGLEGLVCSSRDFPLLEVYGITQNFMVRVTPGIRPTGSAANDQKRITTPAEAIRLGATHLVVGRPITEAADPRAAAEAILNEIAQTS